MSKTKRTLPNFKKISEMFNFNENLISINYYTKRKFLSFTFNNIASVHKEMDTFDISIDGCDLSLFEEFGESCIVGFKGVELTNQQITNISKEIFYETTLILKKESQPKKSASLANNSKKVKAISA